METKIAAGSVFHGQPEEYVAKHAMGNGAVAEQKNIPLQSILRDISGKGKSVTESRETMKMADVKEVAYAPNKTQTGKAGKKLADTSKASGDKPTLGDRSRNIRTLTEHGEVKAKPVPDLEYKPKSQQAQKSISSKKSTLSRADRVAMAEARLGGLVSQQEPQNEM